MIRYLKILLLLLFILWCYISIIKFFPLVWTKIDSIIWPNINSKLLSNTDKIINNVLWIKNNTNNLIDGVWTNTKSKSKTLQRNLNEIKN
jgi:hypothetical protein